jgi:heme-degrading monooxygenase HmoA
MVFAAVDPSLGAEFEQAYLQVAARMKGTPGLLGDQLLADADAPGRYILFGEWESEEAFRAWEDAPEHHDVTVPMRPYWSGRFERRICHVAASLGCEQ